MAGFNSVSDLKHFKTMWRVRVSIVCLWKQYSAAGGLTIEMVLIDSNGDKIHASAKKNWDVRLPTVLWGKFASDVTNAIQLRSEERVILVLGLGRLRFGKVEKCIVMCTIAAIDSDMGLYYLSCKVCSKKVQYEPPLVTGDHDDDDLTNFKIYCAKCKCYDPKLLPSYKLHLVVLDNTGTSKFLLFDNLALQLVHQPCIELTRPVTDEIQYPDVIPLALQNLVGRTYLFKVEILRENFVYKHDTFKVNKIITNLDIIREFDTPKDQGIQTLELENSVISDAPEGSLMLLEEPSSQQGGPSDLTPAKRRGGPVVNLEEEFDQNSVTKMGITTRIKKEKFDKSG
ncbi:uncharacterized protein LOC106356991 [Brassica napus]|uniref:uncharacterized protein LOC106356991 n=1 Tax=Brassica napus TaxID=3708 RepID=UPI000BBE3981|nr:uncharacterized protein LOC106356991 [Brassica napus]